MPDMTLRQMDMETELKVIVVGNGQVGKTSLITRYADGKWTDTYKKTIGTDFMEKEIFLDSIGETVKLYLWDTAGQEMFSKLTRSYYRGAGAVVYVFSTVDRESFLEIRHWQQKVKEECGNICSVLVQNKMDLIDEAKVKPVEVEDLARSMGVKLYRTCVKENLRVNDIFSYLAEMFVNQDNDNANNIEATPHIGSIGSNSAKARPDTVSPKQPTNTISLEPSVRRTKGKKKKMCVVL